MPPSCQWNCDGRRLHRSLKMPNALHSVRLGGVKAASPEPVDEFGRWVAETCLCPCSRPSRTHAAVHWTPGQHLQLPCLAHCRGPPKSKANAAIEPVEYPPCVGMARFRRQHGVGATTAKVTITRTKVSPLMAASLPQALGRCCRGLTVPHTGRLWVRRLCRYQPRMWLAGKGPWMLPYMSTYRQPGSCP